MAERMWKPSPSPVETYSDDSGGNEDGEWPVKAVVGEEIRLDGTSRYSTLHYDPMISSDDLNTHPQIRSTSSYTIYLAPVPLTFLLRNT